MLKSMTGYGRAEVLFDTKRVVVEMKSVNHRFADINIKLPRIYSFLEEKIREEVKRFAARGKIDVFIIIDDFREDGKQIQVDMALASQYKKAVDALSETFSLQNDLTAGQLARFPDIFQIDKTEEDHAVIWQEVKQALDEAGENFLQMRQREGERIGSALLECGTRIRTVVEQIEQLAPAAVEDYRQRLREKIVEFTQQQDIDETRLLTEVAIFADKVCTDEELTRLGSHLKELDHLLHLEEPVGRKLDFLIQEMNREVNTIGSKCNQIEIAKLVVDTKAEIEKLREQVQNIE
ncbi:MAG: YicC family protein [Clostridia bacterium]|nr:YicC family protein [Clostridia bacterium]